MTDFDQKLAELEANSDRVPELKMVVELFRMLRDQEPKCHGHPVPGHTNLSQGVSKGITCPICGKIGA